MTFHRPVRVGDVVCVYADIREIGTTSLTVGVEAWAHRRRDANQRVKVTEGVFTYVAIGDDGKKRSVLPE